MRGLRCLESRFFQPIINVVILSVAKNLSKRRMILDTKDPSLRSSPAGAQVREPVLHTKNFLRYAQDDKSTLFCASKTMSPSETITGARHILTC